jgi:hypothetical protein
MKAIELWDLLDKIILKNPSMGEWPITITAEHCECGSDMPDFTAHLDRKEFELHGYNK